jgi:ectoine hydroxylase-related dioxygenase (phytanoyl-CoA dioxygenase family)
MSSAERLSPGFHAQDESRDFCRDGFVVLEEFLDRCETAQIHTLVESTLHLPSEMACTRPHNTLLPLRWNDHIVQLLLRSERRMQALSDAAEADDLKWISGYVSIKEALSPALWWHQDWWCWDHRVSYQREAPQMAILCYSTNTSIHNGALRVLPRSHLRSTSIHALLPEAHGQGAGNLESEHVAMNDLPGQVTLSLRAGDAVAIDYRLLHGTHGNASSSRRHCILLSFTPSWRRLPEEIRAHLIDHPAQPSDNEASQTTMMISDLLPTFDGLRRSLPLNRNAPPVFQIPGEV